MPAVELTPIMLMNRVDGEDSADDIVELTKPRVQTITSETGALTIVSYSTAQCHPADDFPAPEKNTRRCFPTYWSPQGGTERQLDWFHKYVVTDVFTADTTGGSPPIHTHYDYADDAGADKGAWHHADDPISLTKWRTWSQWRGYSKVTTTVGDSPDEPQSKTVSVYCRAWTATSNPETRPTRSTSPEPGSTSGTEQGTVPCDHGQRCSGGIPTRADHL